MGLSYLKHVLYMNAIYFLHMFSKKYGGEARMLLRLRLRNLHQSFQSHWNQMKGLQRTLRSLLRDASYSILRNDGTGICHHHNSCIQGSFSPAVSWIHKPCQLLQGQLHISGTFSRQLLILEGVR